MMGERARTETKNWKKEREKSQERERGARDEAALGDI